MLCKESQEWCSHRNKVSEAYVKLGLYTDRETIELLTFSWGLYCLVHQ